MSCSLGNCRLVKHSERRRAVDTMTVSDYPRHSSVNNVTNSRLEVNEKFKYISSTNKFS